MNSTSSNPSIESHLSTARSYHRLRSSKQNSKTQPSLSMDKAASDNLTVSARILGLAPASVICIAILYGTFSVIFLSLTLYYKFMSKDLAEHADSVQSSLSRHLNFHSSFYPFVIRGETPTSDSITACLWLEELEDPIPLLAWTSRWPGPISLVLVANDSPFPKDMAHFNFVQQHPSLARVSLHVLSTKSSSNSANAYLNLARLFAQSSMTVLFPQNLSAVPPQGLYESLVPFTDSLVGPLIINEGSRLSYPVPVFSPVMFPREYPIWCTERFFFLAARSSDWNECIWQLWVEEFGQLAHLPANRSSSITEISAATAFSIKIRNRLKSKHRAEMCDVAIRRVHSSTSTKQYQWLRNFCRQTVESGSSSF